LDSICKPSKSESRIFCPALRPICRGLKATAPKTFCVYLYIYIY
jgi:hypothetical protein